MSETIITINDQDAAVDFITKHLRFGRPTEEMVGDLALKFAQSRNVGTMPARPEGDLPAAGYIDLLPDDDRDPWKHRSHGMRCRTCMFFVEKHVEGPRPPDARTLGRCRRHAPTMGGFPAVFEDDWCGEHKLDENKV